MFDLIKLEDLKGDVTVASESDLTIEVCKTLTEEHYVDLDGTAKCIEKYPNAAFATVIEYINFYNTKGYVFTKMN